MNAAFYLSPEIAGGFGISGAHGVAGITYGEAFREGDPSPTMYIARVYMQQIMPLGDEEEYIGEGAHSYIKQGLKNISVLFSVNSVLQISLIKICAVMNDDFSLLTGLL